MSYVSLCSLEGIGNQNVFLKTARKLNPVLVASLNYECQKCHTKWQ